MFYRWLISFWPRSLAAGTTLTLSVSGFLFSLDWFELYCPGFLPGFHFPPFLTPSILIYSSLSLALLPFLPFSFPLPLPTFSLHRLLFFLPSFSVSSRGEIERASIAMESLEKEGGNRAIGVWDANDLCVREREKKEKWGRNRNSFHSHSLDPLRAGPWRMTKPVFSLSHSFSWMFSADNVFASKTKPTEIRFLLNSSVGSQSLIFISLFSPFILPLRPMGIKCLVKQCKHTLPYRRRPCTKSESLCLLRVCVKLFMRALRRCTCAGVWSHYESETLGQGSSARSAHLHHCALTTASVCVHVCLYCIMYACVCFTVYLFSLCMCISELYACG